MPQEVRFIASILVAPPKPALNRGHIDYAMEGTERLCVSNWDIPDARKHEFSGYFWRQ